MRVVLSIGRRGRVKPSEVHACDDGNGDRIPPIAIASPFAVPSPSRQPKRTPSKSWDCDLVEETRRLCTKMETRHVSVMVQYIIDCTVPFAVARVRLSTGAPHFYAHTL